MSRTLIAIAAVLAMTAQAHAGAGFGGSTFQASSTPVTSESETEGPSLFTFIIERFQLVYRVTAGSPFSMPDGYQYDSDQCMEPNDADEGEAAEDSDADELTSGPEPIYFAF